MSMKEHRKIHYLNKVLQEHTDVKEFTSPTEKSPCLTPSSLTKKYPQVFLLNMEASPRVRYYMAITR